MRYAKFLGMADRHAILRSRVQHRVPQALGKSRKHQNVEHRLPIRLDHCHARA